MIAGLHGIPTSPPSKSPVSRGRRLQRWRLLHEEVVLRIHADWGTPGAWRHCPTEALRIFLMSNPFVTVFYHCQFQSRSQRAMLLLCELLGAMVMSCIFFEASGGAASKKNEGKDCETEGLAEELGQLLALALFSLLVAGIPCLVISSLHTRSFVELEEGSEKWRRKLRQWRLQDRLFWGLAALYAAFCSSFVALFLANVSFADHGTFGLTTSIQLLEDCVAIPLGMALFLPLVTSGAVSLSWRLRGGSKELMLRQGRAEVQARAGNWQQYILAI